MSEGREQDLELARRCVEGEEHAWAEIVERCGPAVLAAVRATLRSRGRDRDPALAEEIASDAFASLSENGAALLKSYRGDAALATFVSAVASRKTLRALRDRRRGAAAIEKRAALDEQNPRDDPEPSREAEATELQQAFKKGLAELGDGDRLLLALFYLDGKSYKEIAAATGLAVTGIGTKIARARARLADVLQAQGFDAGVT